MEAPRLDGIGYLIGGLAISLLLFGYGIGYIRGYYIGRNSYVEESGYHTVYNDRVQVKTKNLLGQPCVITVYSEGLNYKGEFLVRVQRNPVTYENHEAFDDKILKNPYEEE